MKPTDEEVNQLARDTAIGQYSTDDHEEYESTVNGYIMGFNEAISQMQPEWISVEDKLPENNAHHTVLINGDRNKSHQMFYTGGYDAIHKEWLNPFGDRIEERITHWMPLPKPPTK